MKSLCRHPVLFLTPHLLRFHEAFFQRTSITVSWRLEIVLAFAWRGAIPDMSSGRVSQRGRNGVQANQPLRQANRHPEGIRRRRISRRMASDLIQKTNKFFLVFAP